MRTLVVNADDFGFTRDVNRGIVEAHQQGILTATTLMATGTAFDDAVRLAHENPALDIGVHLVLVGDTPFPSTVGRLVKEVVLGRIPIYDELRKQVIRVLDSGLRVTHLDTHKHTHLLPPVLRAVARLSEEFAIPFVRRPFDFTGSAQNIPIKKELTAKAFLLVRGEFERELAKHGCRSTDYFAGFRITGRYNAGELVRIIQALPEGTTEFMCHPGVLGDELLGARTRLKESRATELAALCDPTVRDALGKENVRLSSYRALL